MIRDGPGYASASAIAFTALVVISTHSDLSNIYIAVAHSDASQIFLLNFLTSLQRTVR